jgi:hypothetical protein
MHEPNQVIRDGHEVKISPALSDELMGKAAVIMEFIL